jgi:hypothetical protein
MPMHQPLRLRHHVPRRRLLLQPRQATGAQGQGGPEEGGIHNGGQLRRMTLRLTRGCCRRRVAMVLATKTENNAFHD